MGYRVVDSQEENPFAKFVNNQTIVEIPEVTLESGEILYKVPVAYKTWGKLNESGTNCMLITHALTGSSDVADWWGPLLGKGKAFDPSKFFIICLNSLGSPYGSASPVTMDYEFGEIYGPEFPIATVRDDVNIHKLVLDSLGVKEVAICIGGSMGGMLVLEWAFVDDGNYVKSLVALATSAKHSAWCISWGEAQRQCIYADPKYEDGYYSLDDPPLSGLGAARMSAMLTYRSRTSFESRFGRACPNPEQKSKSLSNSTIGALPKTDEENSETLIDSDNREENWSIHNDGATVKKNNFERRRTSSQNNSVSNISLASLDINDHNNTSASSTATSPITTHLDNNNSNTFMKNQLSRSNSISSISSSARQRRRPQHYFSAQSYLRYQGQKFVKRFDANCYISLTRKLDTHDVGRDRPEYDNDTAKALQSRKQPALIAGITSDALFTYSEQIFIAKNLPNSKLKKITSPEGHDAFLLEFKEINDLILDFEKENLEYIMNSEGNNEEWKDEELDKDKTESFFGEAEDVANW